MRRYGQFCALARALDVIGDRWTLLIVRELAARPSRYSDLREGLPGIATNLLADRLRHLESEGIVAHDETSATYRLTERGEALAPVLRELVRWGAPLMAGGIGDDEFRPHWLPLALRNVLAGACVDRPVRVEVAVPGTAPVLIDADGDRVEVLTEPPAARADVTVEGPPDVILGMLGGLVSLARAESDGVVVRGSKAALRRLLSAVPRSAHPVS